MKRTYVTIALLAFTSVLVAQTSADSQKDEINKIKKSKKYIYGEATLPEQSEALKLAKEILVDNINKWVAEQKAPKGVQKPDIVVIRDISEKSEKINLIRGNMHRVFVYLIKSNIMTVENADDTGVLSPSASDNDRETNTSGYVPIQKPVPANIPLVAEADDTSTKILAHIVGITQFEYVGPYFKEQKSAQRMTYGKHTTMTSPEDCYLLIYNKEGEVVAILDKGHRKNLRTRAEDSKDNYKGCGALWFKVF